MAASSLGEQASHLQQASCPARVLARLSLLSLGELRVASWIR